MEQLTDQSTFIDRKGWVIAFACIEIFFGFLCLLFAGFIAIAILLLATQTSNNPMPPQAQIPGIFVYFSGAVFFFTIGTGTIMKKRWARTLMHAFSWIALVCGGASMIIMVFLLPNMKNSLASQGNMPEGVQTIMLIVILLFVSLIYIVLPLVFLLFHRSKNVIATFEHYDPQKRWTDEVPLPVLIATLIPAIWSVGVLITLAYNAAFPLFGKILSGVPGMICILSLSFVYGFLTREIYRRKAYAWWLAMLTTLFFFSSSAITFLNIDLIELYEKMGFEAEAMRPMLETGQITNIQLALWGSIWGLIYFIFMVSIRKYFLKEERFAEHQNI